MPPRTDTQNGILPGLLRRGLLCQKQVLRAGTSNYIPEYTWDVIIWHCPWYTPELLGAPYSSWLNVSRTTEYSRWSVLRSAGRGWESTGSWLFNTQKLNKKSYRLCSSLFQHCCFYFQSDDVYGNWKSTPKLLCLDAKHVKHQYNDVKTRRYKLWFRI